MRTLLLATTPQANEFLAGDPLGLLVGMLLDQQIPMEKAFTSPQVLAERLGTGRLSADALAGLDSAVLEEIFRRPPALHRFPAAMAGRVQDLARVLVADYGSDAASVWTAAGTGVELVRRIGALPGFGEQKARIFAALLGKQFGVRPEGWREAAGAYGEDGSFRSVADVVGADSLAQVRAFKKKIKAAAKAAR